MLPQVPLPIAMPYCQFPDVLHDPAVWFPAMVTLYRLVPSTWRATPTPTMAKPVTKLVFRTLMFRKQFPEVDW